jgi:hypothetical protein
MKNVLNLFLVLGLMFGAVSANALNLTGEGQKKLECKNILKTKEKTKKRVFGGNWDSEDDGLANQTSTKSVDTYDE